MSVAAALAWCLLPWLITFAFIVRFAFEHGQSRERSRWLTTVREGAEHRDQLRGLLYILDRSIEVSEHGWRGKPKLHVLWPLLLVALMPLVGCAAALGTAIPTRPLLTTWIDHGHPVGHCADLELRVRVLYDKAQVRRECRRPAWGCIDKRVSGFAGINEYTLITAIGNEPEHPLPKLLQHEQTHAVRWCAYGDPDPDHADNRMWSHYDWELGKWVDGFEQRVPKVEVQR